MTDIRATKESKERMTLMYKELLDSDTFLDDIGSLRHLNTKDLAAEFLITIEKLNELYSNKKGCRWDSEMILIDLESFECKSTKTYYRLENDIGIVNQSREDVNLIMKAKQFKPEEKPDRLKNVQKDKAKVKDFSFVLATYQRIAGLPRIAIFEELDKCKPKLEEQLDMKKKIEGRFAEFWRKWTKSTFLDCSIKLSATEKASNSFKEILSLYALACFRCEETESTLGLIENLLKATVLRVGKKKASFSIFERIFEILLGYPGLEDSQLLSEMKKKKEICDSLKELETKLKLNDTVSFFEVKDKLNAFKSRCEEIDLKGTEEYIASVVKKIEPIVSRLKPQVSVEELRKVTHHLTELPFKVDEAISVEERIKKIDAFTERFQDQLVIANPERLVEEYRQLDAKIPAFESVMKKLETDKILINSVLGEAAGKLDWHRGLKLLTRLRNVSLMDPKQSQTLVVNGSVQHLAAKFIQYLKKRELCSAEEDDEVILETCQAVPRLKRLDFLRKEKVRGEELSTVGRAIESILDHEMDLEWQAADWMRDKEFELNDLRDGQRFLKNLSKDLDLSAEQVQTTCELPRGAFLEDFQTGYTNAWIEEHPNENLKTILQEMQKNLEKNSVFELGKFGAHLEAERIYNKVRGAHSNIRRFETSLKRVSHFFWKIRAHKYDLLSGLLKSFLFSCEVIERLANRSDSTLKKLEAKLKNAKKSKKVYSRGNKFFGRPDRLISKEAKLKGREERDAARSKGGNLKQIHEDWHGLKAHFKMELEPGLEKSREFDIIFSKLRCREISKPPMNIVFSRQLTAREFYEKVSHSASSKTKEMEVGVFSSPRLRSLRKFLLKRGLIFQANLDGCSLYLFSREQWPNLSSLHYFDQQLKSDSELYCLFIFVPEAGVKVSNGASALKKRDSSSIFGLDEDEMDEDMENHPPIQRPTKKLFNRKDRTKDQTSESEEVPAPNPQLVPLAPVAPQPIAQPRTPPAVPAVPVVAIPMDIEKTEKQAKESKRFRELAQQLRILSVQFEEVKNDFDEFLTDYENAPFSQEDADFFEFAKVFDLLNPDFVYEVGEFEENPDQANQNMFLGNLDQQMAEERLPQNGQFSRESYYGQTDNNTHFSNFGPMGGQFDGKAGMVGQFDSYGFGDYGGFGREPIYGKPMRDFGNGDGYGGV